ncbi:MAG: biosynthetic-type acetolactate synthase large subunit [bacterium]|nr:biosynthetic-type acetolactate synthase large subunit [bacterium]MBU1916544.1 biosynthetic-type acetolactate synthase large subunit [bacterium]
MTVTKNKEAEKLIKGQDLIIKSLEEEGVEFIFGYPGGSSMNIHQSLSASKKIRLVLPRHEQGAAFAASGYARATGKTGVCLATSGPGATNLITGIMDAKMDSIPMVALTGQVPTYSMGMDAFQEVDIFGATLPCVKHSYLVKNTEDIPAIIHEAFQIANSGRKGPVLIDLPKDIQQREIVSSVKKTFSRKGFNTPLEPAKSQVRKAIKLIQEAKRPIVYAGGGLRSLEASQELKRFIEKTGIPVTTTLSGIGCFPEEHKLSLHMLGMHGAIYANMAINRADLVLAIGVRFDDCVTRDIGAFCRDARIIHVDVDASEINKIKIVHVPIQGDAALTLKAFSDEIKEEPQIKPWVAEVMKWKKEFAFSYPVPTDAIVPQHVIIKLKELAPNNSIVSVGIGQHQMWTAQYFRFQTPRSFICSSGFGAMGFGLPAAMGAQMAYPHRTVIDIDGDGSFLMNIQELQTLKTEQIPVKCVVLNNNHLGMAAQWDDCNNKGSREHTYLGEANFAEIADAFGLKGEKISRSEEVEPALKRMLAHKGPYVLDIHYPYNDAKHGHVTPMIPKGKTYLDTIMSDGKILKDYLAEKGDL